MALRLSHFMMGTACTLALIGASPIANTTSTIKVTVINCARDVSVPPTLRLVRSPVHGEDLNSPSVLSTQTTPTAETGVFTTSLTEPVGNYDIGASTPHCRSREGAAIPLYASHARHVILALSSRCCIIKDSYSGSVAVSAPQGVWIDLYKISQSKSLRYRLGTLDSGVTYFSDIESGSYQIVLTAAGATACIPIQIPETLYSTQVYVELDLAMLASLYRRDNQCIDPKTYSWGSR
jgi:hypothetical protein